MSHSLYKIWIHAVWATKFRAHLIVPEIAANIHAYMSDQFTEMDCKVEIINGMPDHVHCLFQLNQQRAIADVIKQVKGSTTYYVNQHQLTEERFAWQTGYAAFSVSESIVNRVFLYIKNQQQHHQKRSFLEEHGEFIRLNGID